MTRLKPASTRPQHDARRSAGRRVVRVFGLLAVLAVGVAASADQAAAQSQLIWENLFADGQVPTPVTIDGTTVTLTGQDPFGIGTGGNFAVSTGTRGNHAGFWLTGMDATNQSQFMTATLSFSQQVESLEFSLLDIDTNNDFHDSITVVGWDGATPFAPTTVFIGTAVNEVSPGVYTGLASIGNFSTDANVDVRFDQLVDSVTLMYGPGPRASANPALQIMGFSDLSWTLPCIATQTVSTTAELRGAVANSCVTLILMNPGTYDLTASGSGQLFVDQDKTFRNVGGGEVIIDGAGASRVMDLRGGITVEIDGLTITGGSAGNGAGIRTRSDLTIRNSTIRGNSGTNGGGLFHRLGTVRMENVTVSGNSSTNNGGGLDLRAGSELIHVTVANNSANNQGGGLRSRSATVSLANTIVADNTQGSGGMVMGTITSVGVNLVEGGCAGCTGADLTGDPTLLPLALNGGISENHALDPSSIAIDAGAVGSGLATDQRGVARPIGAGFDLGAYEAQPSVAVTVAGSTATVDRLPSNGTLYSEAFTVTNTGPSASDYILTATATGSAVVIDSIRGAGLTFGTPADSARTAVLAAGGGSVLVTVFYNVTDVSAGTTDPIDLDATSAVVSSVNAADQTTVTVVRPSLGMTKLASLTGDTIPGAAVSYQMTVTNLGTEAAAQVVVVDSLPPEVDYLLGTTSETLPSGINATLEFDDGSDSWTYSPVSQGCGAATGSDRCVRAIRWTLDTPLPATAPDNAAVFRFTAGIR
ncbi:MAG: right-handed parallel beta-helix repeat-containing protein [Gemmatimonadota bacterium]